MPQDFSGQNLRGRNFKGQDLTGANFSHADIRGANFTNAILTGANFSYAKAGLQRGWAIALVIFSLFLSASSGLVASVSGLWFAFLFMPATISLYTIVPGLMVIILLGTFFIVPIRQGLTVAAAVLIAALAMTLTAAAATSLAVTLVVAAAGAASVAAAVAALGVGALATAVSGAVAGTRAIIAAGLVALTVAISVAITTSNTTAVAATVAVPLAVLVVGLSAYIGWFALVGNNKFALIRQISLFFANTGGTSFRKSDLTDANFTHSTLKYTEFIRANLTRTNFSASYNLNLARMDGTILAYPQIRDLLVTRNGRNKSYIGANLKGANLIGADLRYVNFKEADISEATFEGANLEWANLTLTQAIGTDFTGAQMTGTCLEAWHIQSNTKLNDIDCRFIYLLEDPKLGTDDRERRPSSGEFKPGEFTKLFYEVLTTVDLIFNKGVDWKAFVLAFQKVKVQFTNDGIELSIQSIENRGDGVVVIRVNLPADANKEKIHSEFTQRYILALEAAEEKYKSEVDYLRELTEKLARTPIVINPNQEAKQE
ncbi:pentapeptide repeat-containing protein [Argonema galeatum]|uniref:pentapeptide repeat-containing protein n=1 Tax=Argonema galeatum TaxID=2942762 RepID=UPI002012CBCE|nr:pentapeptide repeat-containing protein [Argonema galeatum]MCL1465079.1 pentapeptide repeat-containing protein [Argonema galeatum A003/A1]